jgi:ABC-2 type transport system ATP-binding protein
MTRRLSHAERASTERLSGESSGAAHPPSRPGDATAERARQPETMPIVQIAGLRKGYDGRTVLDGVTFSVERGEVFGILGQNGAGKTTVVEILEGLRRPDAGSVRVLGMNPWKERRRLSESIGVQLQSAQLPDNIKVAEALRLYASFYTRPKDWRVLLEEWDLTRLRSVRYAKLSGGERQRLMIALALVGQPEIVFLDELTTGLDPNARRATWELVRQLRDTGVTVVIVSHLMDEVEYLCDRVAILDGGAIVAVDSPAMLTALLGGERTMRFVLAEGASAAPDIDFLHALPGVMNVRRLGRSVTVTGRRDIPERVEEALAAHEVSITEVRVSDTTLEDAFMSLADPSGERGAS